jgi:hypothetical protein
LRLNKAKVHIETLTIGVGGIGVGGIGLSRRRVFSAYMMKNKAMLTAKRLYVGGIGVGLENKDW